jgi:hypothetical protein
MFLWPYIIEDRNDLNIFYAPVFVSLSGLMLEIIQNDLLMSHSRQCNLCSLCINEWWLIQGVVSSTSLARQVMQPWELDGLRKARKILSEDNHCVVESELRTSWIQREVVRAGLGGLVTARQGLTKQIKLHYIILPDVITGSCMKHTLAACYCLLVWSVYWPGCSKGVPWLSLLWPVFAQIPISDAEMFVQE